MASVSGVYGLDVPGMANDKVADQDGRISPGALMSLWNTHSRRFSESRKRIRFTNDVITGKIQVPVPRKLAKNRRVFFPQLPASITVSLHNHNVLGRKEPRYKRFTAGTGIAPLSRATRVERWVNPFVLKLVSWDELIGMLQDEAEMGAAILPVDATIQPEPPPFKDEKGEIRKTWWRDAGGLDAQSYRGREKDFKRDQKKSSEAYEEALRDWELDNPSIRVELIHATDCVPVGLRIAGDGPLIDGIIKREKFSRSELLRRDFRWGASGQMEPSTLNGQEDVTLYSGYLTDGHGLPYIVYAVQGAATTWWKDQDADTDWATVDLYKEYGMTRGLWFYDYGWHKALRDADQRGVPFGWPFAQAWMARQAVIGASIVNLYQRGVGARGIRMDPNAPAQAYLDEQGNPRMVEWEPGGPLPILPGEIQDIAPQQMSGDARWLSAELSSDTTSEGPPPGAFGGEGPDSGRERTVMRRHMEDAEAQIFAGGLRLMTRIGRAVLELECLLQTHKQWRPSPVVTDIPLADGSSGARRQQIVTLDPDDVGGNYRVDADFLPKPGENLALVQQAADLVERGFRPRRWLHEDIMGDEQPEQTEAEIVSDKMIYGEQGQADIYELAAQIRNDDKAKKRAELARQGRVTPLSGSPTALAGGLQGPQPMAPQQGQMVGLGLPEPGPAALGGQVGADMETGALMGDAREIGGGMAAG